MRYFRLLVFIMMSIIFSCPVLAMGDLYLSPYREDTNIGYTLTSECIHCWFNEKAHVSGTITFYDQQGNVLGTRTIDNYHAYNRGSSGSYTKFWDMTDYDDYKKIKRAIIKIVASAPNTRDFHLTYAWKLKW